MTAWRAAVKTPSWGGFRVELAIAGDARPVALVGPNGSGKTTTLRAIAGLVGGAEADVVVAGRALSGAGAQAAPELRGVGYVPQGYALFPHLSVVENVAFGLTTGASPERPEVARERALAILAELGAAGLADRRVGGLSGGEAQRVALARALVRGPRLLLLDEPLAALDVGARRLVRAWLADELRRRGVPALIATHDARDIEALDATVVVLDAGRVVQQGDLAELRRAPATEFVAALVEPDR
ncbi:MAG: ABC transporter ATP-binding protein [Myxococcales bacterium]|nr:ABC transporter ATP-binding protein [Myxococcales bacterium]